MDTADLVTEGANQALRDERERIVIVPVASSHSPDWHIARCLDHD